MPLVRVTMIKGKSPDYIKKMSDSIYEALVDGYMQKDDLFQIIEQLEPGDLIYDRQRVSLGRFRDHLHRVRRAASERKGGLAGASFGQTCCLAGNCA